MEAAWAGLIGADSWRYHRDLLLVLAFLVIYVVVIICGGW
jgi:hypothetical protein